MFDAATLPDKRTAAALAGQARSLAGVALVYRRAPLCFAMLL